MYTTLSLETGMDLDYESFKPRRKPSTTRPYLYDLFRRSFGNSRSTI